MYPDHFLDVNILIGARVSLDPQYPKATNYMRRQNIKRCTSSDGFKTAKYHFDFIRSKGRAFLLELSKRNFSDDTYSTIGLIIFNSLDDFKNTRRLSSTEYGRLYSLFAGVMAHLVKDIQKDRHNGVKNFCNNLLSEIERANLSLIRDCNYSVHAPIRLYDRRTKTGERVKYSSKWKELYDIIQDKEDVEIFLDCCHIQRHVIKRGMCFVTTDKKHFSGEEIKLRIEAAVPHINIQPPNYRP